MLSFWLMDRFMDLIGGNDPVEIKPGLPFSANTTINLTVVPVLLLLVVGLFFRS